MRPLSMIKYYVAILLKKHGKARFIQSISKKGKLLDVGCGNNSPFYIKQKRPDIHYTGLDIGVYNQLSGYEKYVDRLLLTTPEDFHTEIEKYAHEFDAVISAHNLEHCNKPKEVVLALSASLKSGGIIYFSFPCEKSLSFPSRKGCLNFYDDPSHQNIVNFDNIVNLLKNNNITIDFATKQYKPFFLSTIGLLFEPISRFLNRPVPFGSTWAYYGFESIIIGHRE